MGEGVGRRKKPTEREGDGREEEDGGKVAGETKRGSGEGRNEMARDVAPE